MKFEFFVDDGFFREVATAAVRRQFSSGDSASCGPGTKLLYEQVQEALQSERVVNDLRSMVLNALDQFMPEVVERSVKKALEVEVNKMIKAKKQLGLLLAVNGATQEST